MHLLIFYFFYCVDDPPACANSGEAGSKSANIQMPCADTGAKKEDAYSISTSADEALEIPASLDSELSDDEEGANVPDVPVLDPAGASEEAVDTSSPTQSDELQHNVKALIDFIAASEHQPLWNYEDITPKQLTIRSSQQLAYFVRHVVAIFSESLPHCHLEERLAQIALHLALSCSSRHYAGRSLQVQLL